MPPKKFEDRQLQAVVLCDSYQSRFHPLTKTKPRCLLPLANTPLIEYTLGFLLSARVTDVYLLCCAHAEQVSEYIRGSRWSGSSVPFKVNTIELPNTSSVGDALRDLDARSILTGDFLLISGDVVCNLDFDRIWESHVKRRQRDKNCIMSIVLRPSTATHRTRSPYTGLYVLEDQHNRVVSYKSSILDKSVSLDTAELLSHQAVSFRNDLIDCHIDICAIDVPALFTENFDYEYLRKDFVNGILQSDLLGKTIYAEIADLSYAARVDSLKSYDAITKDIINRYTYPLCVDANEGGSDQSYRYSKGHNYAEKDVILSQSCQIGSGTVIGGKTKVGSDTAITTSTIGRGCVIGRNVTIKGSYIWDNAVIEDGAIIEQSIVAEGSVIGKDAKLNPGTVVAFGYKVPSGTVVSENSFLAHSYESEDDSYDESSDDDLRNLTSTMEYLDMSDDSISSTTQTGVKRVRKSTRSLSTTSAISMASEDEEEDFFKEAVASLNRSIVDNHEQDVAILELNTLRMTMNASHDKVQAAAVHALVRHIGHLMTQSDAKTAAVGVFTTWSPLLKRVTFDLEGQVELLHLIESECSKLNSGDKILFFAASTLYDTDVISEEAIYGWWKRPAVSSSVRGVVSKWVEWLQTAEEESEDED